MGRVRYLSLTKISSLTRNISPLISNAQEGCRALPPLLCVSTATASIANRKQRHHYNFQLRARVTESLLRSKFSRILIWNLIYVSRKICPADTVNICTGTFLPRFLPHLSELISSKSKVNLTLFKHVGGTTPPILNYGTIWKLHDPAVYPQGKSPPYIHSSVICQTTGPQPLPKRFLHLTRSRASSFK
jgi:hypothetical protein